MEALETEQLPSPGPSPLPRLASLLPVTPNPLFSQRLTRLHPLTSHLSDHQEAPLGLHPHPQQVPRSAGAELRGHVRAAFILALQSLGLFPEAPKLLIFHQIPTRRPHEERQAAVLHALVPGQGDRRGLGVLTGSHLSTSGVSSCLE